MDRCVSELGVRERYVGEMGVGKPAVGELAISEQSATPSKYHIYFVFIVCFLSYLLIE